MAQILRTKTEERWVISIVTSTRKRHRKSAHQKLFEPGPRKKVLVFSPDADLAHSLVLLLENRFVVSCETNIERVEHRVHELSPHLLLFDLFSRAPDTISRINIIKRMNLAIPIVLLRGYAEVSETVEQEIRKLTTWIFYKPMNGELIGDVLETALAESKHNKKATV